MSDDTGEIGSAATQFNTPLTPDEQQQFQAWGAQQPKNPQAEMQDYDLQGWWKANPGQNLGDGHLTDQWKKPNHPTFSDQSIYHGVDGNEGGRWTELGNEKYSFTPGRTNFDNHPIQNMKNYFQQVEPGNTLDVSSYPTEQGYLPAYLRQKMQ